MFQPGDFVVYGSSGVCRVIRVGALESRAADPSRQDHTLQPVFEAEVIYTPVDSGVFMRPAMTKEQAQRFIQEIPSIQGDVCTERNPASLRIHYETSLQSHQCRELVSMIKGIRSKGRETRQKGPENGPGGPALSKEGRGSPARGAGHRPGHNPGGSGGIYPQNRGTKKLSEIEACRSVLGLSNSRLGAAS